MCFGWGKLEYYESMEETTKKGGTKFGNFIGGGGKRGENMIFTQI